MKSYKIVMKTKHEIKIDADEIPKIMKAIAIGGQPILKQTIFDPSSYSHIVEDKEREKIQEVDDKGHYTGKSIPKPLEDIFEGIEFVAQLKTAEIKRLKN